MQSPLLFTDTNGNQAGEITGHAIATGPLPPSFDGSTVVCNGLGDLIYFQSLVLTQEQIKCFGECDREHEMIHRRDFLRSNPTICKGQPANTSVGFAQTDFGTEDIQSEAQTEVNAFTAEIECLEAKIASENEKNCPECLEVDEAELAKSKDLLARYQWQTVRIP